MNNELHPYSGFPSRAFWRRSVSDRHFSELKNLWNPMELSKHDKIATAGSCFAQHIGNSLMLRGASWMDLEPAPPIFDTAEEARRWGYGVFSCRYGNIYTTRQLLQLFQEAVNDRVPAEIVWTRNGRFFDALRPNIDPVGQEDEDSILDLRAKHLSAVKRMWTEVDVFIFTLGLTEGWRSRVDDTMFPLAPGVVAGAYDKSKYAFHNLTYSEVKNDLLTFWHNLRTLNSKARLLLTISPVPLIATATNEHVLVATSYSKSVLRAVAGELCAYHDDIIYFPSYEIINAHPARAMFYESDLRDVSKMGVDYVMSHFFSGRIADAFGDKLLRTDDESDIDLICDEDKLDEEL